MSQEFAVEDIQDPNKPEISWYYQSENAEIKIVVKSEKGIKNLNLLGLHLVYLLKMELKKNL